MNFIQIAVVCAAITIFPVTLMLIALLHESQKRIDLSKSQLMTEPQKEIAYLNELIGVLDKRIKELQTRLEYDPSHSYDGISCRDETIKLQDAHITKLKSIIKHLDYWGNYD